MVLVDLVSAMKLIIFVLQVGVTKEPWKPNLTQLNNSTNQRAAGGQHQTQHYNNNKSKLVSRSGGAENSPPTNTTTTSPSCKDSFRDYLLIERKSASIEQLAAFVSS